jgi:hypothetical protein
MRFYLGRIRNAGNVLFGFFFDVDIQLFIFAIQAGQTDTEYLGGSGFVEMTFFQDVGNVFAFEFSGRFPEIIGIEPWMGDFWSILWNRAFVVLICRSQLLFDFFKNLLKLYGFGEIVTGPQPDRFRRGLICPDLF